MAHCTNNASWRASRYGLQSDTYFYLAGGESIGVESRQRSRRGVMKLTAVHGGLLPIVHPVTPYDHSNSQPVILENVRTAFALCRTMQLSLSPRFNRFIVSPEGERKQFSRFRKT